LRHGYIAGSFHENPLTAQETRLKLANAILAAVAANGPDNVGLSRGKGPTRAAPLPIVKDRTSGGLYHDNKHASMKAPVAPNARALGERAERSHMGVCS